jgi:hypothetical protein
MTDANITITADNGGVVNTVTKTVIWPTAVNPVTVTATSDDNELVTASFNVRIVEATPALPQTSWTATASSEYEQYSAAEPPVLEQTYYATYAIDNNMGSRWASNPVTVAGQAQEQWLLIDLGADYSVAAIDVLWEGACAANAEVQISADGEDFVTQATETRGNAIWNHTYRALTDQDATTRYVRILCKVPATVYRYSIFEIKIYGAQHNAIWNGASSNWNDPANWTPEGVPSQKTNVLIPSGVDHYPNLTTDAYANNIRFESGAEVGNIQKLHYFTTEVEFNLTNEGIVRNRYYTIGAPLKDMVVGDFSFGGNPSAYAKYAKNILTSVPGVTVGSYTGGFTDDLPDYNIDLPRGFGFAWRVAENGYANTLKFPYFMNQPATNDATALSQTPNKHHQYTAAAEDATHKGTSYFYYFYTGGGSRVPGYDPSPAVRHKTDVTIGNTTKTVHLGHRFIAEGNDNKIPDSFDIDLVANGNLVANPFMSHLNFAGLFTGGTNNANIKPFYRLWNGSNYYTVDIESGETTDYANQKSAADFLIAPMQSFMIEPITNTLTVKVADVSTVPATGGATLRAANAAGNVETLKVIARSEAGGSSVVVQRGEGLESYHIAKLFTFVPEVPELYIIQDQAVEIALMDKETASVALGLRAPESASVTLSFVGLNSFTETVSLYDDQTQTTTDLSESNNTYSFTNNASNMGNRFFLLFSPNAPTSVNRITGDQVSVTVKDNTIRVVSSPLDPIRSIKIYNMQGQLAAEKTNLSAVSCNIPVQAKAAYIVEVITDHGQSVKKVINY